MSSKGKSNMVGNREIAQEAAEDITYDANDLNQYTRISTNGEDFTPEYDADGNQTIIQTSTGIWKVQYNAQNRAIKFESKDGHTVITCGYDYMGRRFEKKVTVDGTTTLHERYIYRGYLQIAALDMLHDAALIHAITWDPTQEIATRPLAIRENGVWYTYGWDLTKNICELYGQEGFIRTIYTYSPYGQVTAEGDVTQCIQWSSEVYDAETGLVYYNYRYYNPLDGRWTRRDPDSNQYFEYHFCLENPVNKIDSLGLKEINDYVSTDSFNRQCCRSQMVQVQKIVFRPFEKREHFVGHAAISCPGLGIRGKYPKDGCTFMRIIGKAEIKNDKWMQEPSVRKYLSITTYTACPESLQKIRDLIEKNTQSPGPYSLVCANCEDWVDAILSGAMEKCCKEIQKRESFMRPIIHPPGTKPVDPEMLRSAGGRASIPIGGFSVSF